MGVMTLFTPSKDVFLLIFVLKKIDLSLFSTSCYAKYLHVVEDGPGWGHLCHTDTFLVIYLFPHTKDFKNGASCLALRIKKVELRIRPSRPIASIK